MPKKKTHEEFVKEVYDLVGDEYSFLSSYINATTYITIKHNICNHVYDATPGNFKAGKRCPLCAKISRANSHRKTDEEFKKLVYESEKGKYSVLGIYEGCFVKIKMKHNMCKYEYFVAPSKFLSGDRCPNCAGNIKKSDEEFKNEVFDLVGYEYKVLGTYTNAKTKLKIKHEKCGHIYKIAPNTFLRGNRCPKCILSKGENIISNFFKQNNVEFISQYRFNECRNKKPLPFDFAVFNEENKLIYLIEYDGEQHFKPFRLIKDKTKRNEHLEKVQHRDSIKNVYCNENNIKLYRIPYWKLDDIESILIKLINNEHVDVDETSFLIL